MKKTLMLFGAAISGLFAVAAAVSAAIIVVGIVESKSNDPMYFTLKLVIYFVEVVVLAYLAKRLFRAAMTASPAPPV